MSKRTRKLILLSIKLLIAAGLLTWVLSRVHWSDYVRTVDGQTHAILEVAADPAGQKVFIVPDGPDPDVNADVVPADPEHLVPAEKGTQEYVWPGFVGSIRRMDAGLLGLAMVGFLLTVLITAIRWWLLLRLQAIRMSRWEAIRLTFLGQFFNAVVPGTVGGDLVKAYYASKHTRRKAAAVVSIFVDRVIGMTELALLAGVMLLVVWLGGLAEPGTLYWPAITVAVVLGGLAMAVPVLLSPRLRKILHVQKLYQRLPISKQISAAGRAASRYGKRWPYLVMAIGMTVLAHVCWIGGIALVGLALSMDTPVWAYFVYVPLIYILGAVPISPGGVGWVESLYQSYFSLTAGNPSAVLALALLARLIPIFWSLPGAIVAVRGARLPRAEVMQAELNMPEEASDQ